MLNFYENPAVTAHFSAVDVQRRPGVLIVVMGCREVLFSRLESADPEWCGGPFGEHGGIGE